MTPRVIKLFVALMLAGSTCAHAQGGGGSSGGGAGTSSGGTGGGAAITGSSGVTTGSQATAPSTTGTALPRDGSLSNPAAGAESTSGSRPPPAGTNRAGTAEASGPPPAARGSVTTESAAGVSGGRNVEDRTETSTDRAVRDEERALDRKIKSICRGC